MKASILLAAVFLLSSSAEAQAKRMIEVPLQMPVTKALDYVQLAAVRHNFVVQSNTGGVIEFEPHQVKKNNPTTVTLRINVLSTSDSTSVAIVSGRWFSPLTAGVQRVMLGRDYVNDKQAGEPIEQATKGWRADLWKIVQDFASSLETK